MRASITSAITAVTVFSLLITVLSIFLYYVPDYLHLTVSPEKARRWEFRVRWRLFSSALLIGVLLASTGRDIVLLLCAIGWLSANLLTKSIVPARVFALYFWVTDCALLSALVSLNHLDPLVWAALLASAVHLSIVVSHASPLPWAAVVIASGWVQLFLFGLKHGLAIKFQLAAGALLFTSAIETAWLVQRAKQRNRENAATELRELKKFTGYSEDRIRHLWTVSNRELAKNWLAASLTEDDPEAMADWYRKNSELYLFAISSYNLEYKRILSNLHALDFARGVCLDYGAGNGELVLEIARRGHPAIYYDVDGKTMEYARYRANESGLNIQFIHSKHELAAAAKNRGMDTILSFDVLEHLPDLAGELAFLASLLNPLGQMIFDVPAGSTKAHPMHLNHRLNVRAHLKRAGLEEEGNILTKLSFPGGRYLFRRPASLRIPE